VDSRVVTEVADDVFVGRGTDVNWVLLREGSDVTLIDSGWAGDLPTVLASLEAIGARPEDVRAILITHAHIDHLGAVNHLYAAHGTPVYFDDVEVAHARREYLEQAGRLDVAKNIWRPGVLAWTARVARVGALQAITVPQARSFPATDESGALDLPGRPVPVATHGHTSGHAAFHLPAVGAIVTGDGLVTGHPATPWDGPHLLGPMFNHSQDDALAALEPLAGLAADLLLPGHGPVYRGPIAGSVATARERATRRGPATSSG
jgi:glyoxylase-like metal-dependent hydrolase (beta-lactamase superfamily II)